MAGEWFHNHRVLPDRPEDPNPFWSPIQEGVHHDSNVANATALGQTGAAGDDGRTYLPCLYLAFPAEDSGRDGVIPSGNGTPVTDRRSRSRKPHGLFEQRATTFTDLLTDPAFQQPAWQPEPTPNPDNSNEPIAPTVPQGGKQLRREISSEPVAPKMREGGEHLGREVACTWELLEKGQPHFEATTVHIRPPRLGADPQHRAHNPSDPCRHILTSIDIASLAAGGLMTATILNFNQNVPGTCPSPSADPRWAASIPLLRHMPQALRCPDPSTYVLALSVYSAVGMLQVALEPRYWADCGLVAALATVGAGGVYGPRYMVDVLILGGFLSLVCSKVVAWYVDYCGRGERGVGRN